MGVRIELFFGFFYDTGFFRILELGFSNGV